MSNDATVQKLGEILFNGGILVFAISFGLFPFYMLYLDYKGELD